ncbi:Cell division protein ftsH-like protein [Strawberry lethal yellows phytoplasma (CPA) str. NZSb11]|uniref:Cell division protein ftsH-like protein n=2 Tax=Phytoplasma australiense TaxID=59748 RepID=R4RY88_PHYAS|nr:ATP-binding protein [Candidatus Phytoplasma australiense]AGL90887.1 Cell division protein ftsH-like protein [Strawberry lethal yellows phytoplasma (CPA) str. NZSb11]
MKTKNKSRSQPLLSKVMTIIILFFLFWLATYVWIHHQTLSTTEEKINQHKGLLKQQEEQPKDKKQTLLNNNNLPTNTNLQKEGVFFDPSDPQKFIGLDKLIGFKEELKAVQGFMDYLKNPENYQGIGQVEPPLGILMYGCPGTGKTTLARALAKETNLPFFEVNSSLFSQKYKGLAPKMVKDLFEDARIVAEESNGAIIFLDECETIFTDLSMLEAGSEIANVVNQFKTEMTSMNNNPDKPIFIIGATNQYHLIDEAIKSRFDFNIEVTPGGKAERQQMLEFLTKKRKNPYSEEAKQYLFEVINEALERLPQNQQFLKANRTLENLFKTTVSIFAKNRGKGENKRSEINKEDLKQAYQLIISPDTSLLDQIENNLTPKGGE